ncbi:MAG: endolytic transglycosylase MltG, partial [Terriglobales bacterium]
VLDKKIPSPYNTYLHSGWPPGAIANPGILAIEAALHPMDSPYWYYLSDPESGKTIFAKTIEEQVAHQLKYLRKN